MAAETSSTSSSSTGRDRSRPRRPPRYWSKKPRQEGPWDAVVIGSGMGGMTAAAILAKLGKKVLVIEQHYVPGGFTHMFKRPGYEWDVGVHAVGEVTEHSMTGRLLSLLTDGQLEWSSLGSVYDEFYYPDEFRIDFPDNPKQFRANLLTAFPDEEDAIDGYLSYVRDVAGSMKAYYLSRVTSRGVGRVLDKILARKAQKYLELNTRDVINSLTDNEKLRSVFAAQWGYYGSTPGHSSFAMQALVVKHFMWGGYYPVGGAGEIARTLLKTVADAGGWTRISTNVEEIVIEGGKAVGVKLDTGEEIRAPRIISAAGVLSTVKRLLPPDAERQRWAQAIEELEPGPAHVCLYLGFEGDIREAGASSANKWFYETWDTEVEGWDVHPDDEELPDCPVLYCSFPSLKDPTHDPGPDQHHTGEVVTFVPWESFERWQGTRWKKRGEEYDAFKEKMTDKLLEQFLEHLPGLRDKIDHVELSTPLSTHNFTRPMAGSIYGLEPTPDRFRNPWLRPKSPVPNLYFAGSEVASVGVIGAMMGGVLAAMAAEPLKVFNLVRKVG